MEYKNLTTGEKFGEAEAVLESVAEHELEPEDRDKHLSLIMELQELHGKYQDGYS